MLENYDVVILGGGASGLMCARTAALRGRRVLLIDHMHRLGNKIRVSGGGCSNFTNRDVKPAHYVSQNPRFCTSALARFGPSDILALFDQHGISYCEREHGQLFGTESAEAIVNLFVSECQRLQVTIRLKCRVGTVTKTGTLFRVETDQGDVETESLVVATGGLSYPRLGASDFGYQLAQSFGLNVVPCEPGLTPFRWRAEEDTLYGTLAGVTQDACVTCRGHMFHDAVLFTHHGLSGPALLQASNYWQPDDTISIDLSPSISIAEVLKRAKRETGRRELKTVLSVLIPRRLADIWCETYGWTGKLADTRDATLEAIAKQCHHWCVMPQGTEDYTKAEVTLGGIDTAEFSPKTMEAKRVPGLYCIGEVLDVTGWLGGYNLQWAWSSGYAAGLVV